MPQPGGQDPSAPTCEPKLVPPPFREMHDLETFLPRIGFPAAARHKRVSDPLFDQRRYLANLVHVGADTQPVSAGMRVGEVRFHKAW